MSIKVFNGHFFNFGILWLNPSNFTFKIANFLIDPIVSIINITTRFKQKIFLYKLQFEQEGHCQRDFGQAQGKVWTINSNQTN